MRIQLVGVMPLLMHNVRLADDLDPYKRAISVLTAKKTKKTDEDKLEIDRLSFAGGLYHDAETGPYIPAANILRCLREAAAQTREGKTIEQGVIFGADHARLEYDGPRDIAGLWGNDGDSPFVDRRMVTVDRKRIPRVRPCFPEWALSIPVEIDTTVIKSPEAFADIVARAGRVGIGDYRSIYGKFVGTVVSD